MNKTERLNTSHVFQSPTAPRQARQVALFTDDDPAPPSHAGSVPAPFKPLLAWRTSPIVDLLEPHCAPQSYWPSLSLLSTAPLRQSPTASSSTQCRARAQSSSSFLKHRPSISLTPS